MITVVQYLVIAAVIGAVMFGIAIFVFGRGEQLAPLPARMSPVELPASDLRGDHVRHVRFGLALRGYRMSDVDWALERLADELDVLHHRLDAMTADSSDRSEAGSAGIAEGSVAAGSSSAGPALAAGGPAGPALAVGTPAGLASAAGAPADTSPAAGATASESVTAGTADAATTP